jgi:hypothetical protein
MDACPRDPGLLRTHRQRSLNWLPEPTPADPQAALSAFREQYAALNDRIRRVDETVWRQKGRLLVQGHLYREAPWASSSVSFLGAIHHCGQLSTYIRPMSGKASSICEPSGDDPGDVKASQSAKP